MHPLVPLAIRILVPPVVQALLVSRLVLEPAQQVVQALEQHQVLVLVLELELELVLELELELELELVLVLVLELELDYLLDPFFSSLKNIKIIITYVYIISYTEYLQIFF